MRNFAYAAARRPADAVGLATPRSAFIAGGTDILNLLKDDLRRVDRLIDINAIPLAEVAREEEVLWVGALARMADVAAHPAVRNAFPVVSQALLASASPQIRNMASIGGNLLQRTRCGYFRDSGSACNKRVPGSGCPAWDGENRGHALFGGSDACIAVHPSDLAVALVAADATVVTTARRIPIGDLHVVPGDTPERETVLRHDELITGVELPLTGMSAKSRYLKLRDRATFEFAVVSVAAGLDLRAGVVRDVRLAFGGVATKPWRSPDAEAVLRGKRLTAQAIEAASTAATAGAVPRPHNEFKVTLLQRAVTEVLEELGGVR